MGLKNIHIVLARAENPINIGQTARAMKNFGVSKLILVNCADHRVDEALTPGWKARQILLKAKCLKSLSRAFLKNDLSIGFTTRFGRERGGTIPFPKLTQEILAVARKKEVFLVFGNEKNGLSNDELGLCYKTATIPATKAYSSLNLSHAVVAVLSRLYSENLAGQTLFQRDKAIHPAPGEFNNFVQQLHNVMLEVGYKPQGPLDEIYHHMRDFFRCSQMDKRQLHMFQSFFGRIRATLKAASTDKDLIEKK